MPKIMPMSRDWITIFCFINGLSASITELYLFKEKTRLKNYINNYEEGACMVKNPNARMTIELFMKWLCHFVAYILVCIVEIL